MSDERPELDQGALEDAGQQRLFGLPVSAQRLKERLHKKWTPTPRNENPEEQVMESITERISRYTEAGLTSLQLAEIANAALTVLSTTLSDEEPGRQFYETNRLLNKLRILEIGLGKFADEVEASAPAGVAP